MGFSVIIHMDDDADFLSILACPIRPRIGHQLLFCGQLAKRARGCREYRIGSKTKDGGEALGSGIVVVWRD
jgi:hypothetical protein